MEQLGVGLGHPRDHVDEVCPVDRVLVVGGHVHAGEGATTQENVQVQVGWSGPGVLEVEERRDLESVPDQVLEVHVPVDQMGVIPRFERRSSLASEVRGSLEQQLVDVLVPPQLLDRVEQGYHR